MFFQCCQLPLEPLVNQINVLSILSSGGRGLKPKPVDIRKASAECEFLAKQLVGNGPLTGVRADSAFTKLPFRIVRIYGLVEYKEHHSPKCGQTSIKDQVEDQDFG